jgi:poly-gamma-glutamate capsule biosynthesis protein CapA/YwtB (metallophosphatase superfamily)
VPYQASSGEVTVALAGDAMITRALRPFTEPEFLALRELLRSADAAFANGEMLFHNYEFAPAHRSATWMRCDPRLIADLSWLGISLLSCANNHAYDFGENAVLGNIANLDAAGMAHAGTGANLADAVAPAYLDTGSGRIALIASTTSARYSARAGEQRPDMRGRPGTNLLRWMAEWTVDAAALRELRRVADALGWPGKPSAEWSRSYGFGEPAAGDPVYFADRAMFPSSDDPLARFVAAEEFGRRSRLHVADLDRNLRSIGEARRLADLVIFSVHNHESGPADVDPAEHVVDLAHRAIDAGADIVIGHGPHRDRGMEIYGGRPIFYALGNFVAENNTVARLPQDAMDQFGLGLTASAVDLYELREEASRRGGEGSFGGNGPFGQSVVPMVSFRGGQLAEIRLHPIELGGEAPRSQRGRPMLATGAAAKEALDQFAALSAPFGVTIEARDGVGVVRL